MCLIVIENGLICEDHDFLKKMLLLLDLSELLGYYHEDTKVVLSHLALQLLNDFRETEVLNELIDWNVDRADANTLEALVSLLDIIKSFVILDQVVEATKFDVLLDIILVDLAALKVLLRTLVVVVRQLLEHLLVQLDPFVDLEVDLEVDGVKGEWSAGEESEVLGVFAVGGVKEVGLLEHLLDDEGGSATADDDLLLSDGVEVLLVVGVVIDDVMDFVFNALKLLGKLVEVNEPNALDSSKDFILLALKVIFEDDVIS